MVAYCLPGAVLGVRAIAIVKQTKISAVMPPTFAEGKGVEKRTVEEHQVLRVPYLLGPHCEPVLDLFQENFFFTLKFLSLYTIFLTELNLFYSKIQTKI